MDPGDRGADAAAAVKTSRICAAYLVAQAVIGVAFWVALSTSATVRSSIELLEDRRAVTDAFFFADLIVVAGSAIGAWATATERAWAVHVLAFTAGGIVYPTVFLVGWVSLVGTGAVALAVMIPPSIITCWITYQAYKHAPGARFGATPADRRRA